MTIKMLSITKKILFLEVTLQLLCVHINDFIDLINLYLYKYENVCVCVCVFAFFSAIS